MDEPFRRRYDVTVTVARDGGHLPDPAAFATAAEQAAAARHASGVMSAHSAGQIITVVTVESPDHASAVAVALAVVSDALGRPVASSG
jgi:Mrp family chromosome partitioning ATPase